MLVQKVFAGKLHDKDGLLETVPVTIKKGECVCICGKTGSGKSRLLEDIEYLAWGDSPSGRKLLINGKTLSEKERTPEALQKTVNAALREYEKKSLREGERILDQEVTYTETPGLIKADVLLEVERDIGVEQKIDMKKEDAEREKK